MSAVSGAAIQTPLPLYDERPLPAGWLQRVDERTNCGFYVDTLGRPPHSIWVHPLEDPGYLRKTGQIYPDEEKVPAYTFDEKIRPSRPSDEDNTNADSSESPAPTKSVEPTQAGTPSYAAAEGGPSAANSNSPPRSVPESGPSNSKGKKATIFSGLKGKSNSRATSVDVTFADRETKRESEAKAYCIQREVMLAKRKEESSDADFARLLTRPYTAPLPSDYGGPRYRPPVHKSFGEKLSGFADGAFNLVFGSTWPERYGDERATWT